MKKCRSSFLWIFGRVKPSDPTNTDCRQPMPTKAKTLGKQNASIKNISHFQREIASSRTFCFLHELEDLLEKNLVKGGDINNAIVVVENEI